VSNNVSNVFRLSRTCQTWSWVGFTHGLGWVTWVGSIIPSVGWVELGWVGLSQTVSMPSLYCKSLLANCTSYGE